MGNTSVGKVAVVMGSDSDFETMREAVDVLRQFGVECLVDVISAHRTPDKAHRFARDAESNGYAVIIAGAGGAAHLAGVLAAQTIVPVIGVPMPSRLNGLDSLLSTVQMPAGVPVATVAVGSAGARNAGLLAVQILAHSDPGLREKLRAYRQQLAADVEERAAKVRAEAGQRS